MNQRIIKEVRLLFWPWCLIVIAALLPLLRWALHPVRELLYVVCAIGFFGGIPFLVALSLGGEFQQRTFALLLGQPVERTRIWAEKEAVLLVALACAIPVFWFCWPAPSDLTGDVLGLIGAWLVVTISSATFWTLVARSTLGGLVLGQAAQVILGAIVINTGLRLYGSDASANDVYPFGAAVFLGYSGLMLWLGRRKLLRFQATGGAAGGDLLTAGPRMLPVSIADALRCRATGPTLNLIRKELRLLRPLWLITLLFLVCWVCIVLTFRVLPSTVEWAEWRQAVPLLAFCIYIPLAVMLAGCLSLGEERTSGTHAWHLTLPVSARRQWFIKLMMALGAGVFCAMIVPLLAVAAGQLLFASPFGPEFKWNLPSTRDGFPLLLAIFASFPAFWCACAVNGTVRAALWTLPVICALCVVGAGGVWVARQLEPVTVPLMTVVVARFQLNPNSLANAADNMRGEMWALWLIFPTVLAAVIQSCRLFCMQPSDRILPVLRRILPLALVAFLCAISCGAFVFLAEGRYDSILVRETRAAIEELQIDATQLDAIHPLNLSVDDLAKVSPLSAVTRQWLRTASITIHPATKGRALWYVATIHFSNGSDYPLSFRARGQPSLN